MWASQQTGKCGGEYIITYSDAEGASVETMRAVEALLSVLEGGQRKVGVLLDEFRLWSNPELYVNPGGLRPG